MIGTTNESLSKVNNYYHTFSTWMFSIYFVKFHVNFAVLNVNICRLRSENEQDKAKNFTNKFEKVSMGVGFLIAITNILSCIIIFMTFHHAYKITQNKNNDTTAAI